MSTPAVTPTAPTTPAAPPAPPVPAPLGVAQDAKQVAIANSAPLPTRKYRLKRGVHYVQGVKLTPGETTDLNARQAEAWRDRFEPVEEEKPEEKK